MKLTWLGHACFLAEQDGYRILLDPYTGVEGYPPLKEQALRVHKILCSHGHFDHNAADQAELVPFDGPCPFAVRTVETFHDGQGGALRGNNTVHILSAGGVTVAHMGDLGHQLSREQIAAIGPVDLVMIPVGGTYTVDAKDAKAVCQALVPGCVVPMHYRHAPYGLPNVAGVEDFLALWPEVRRLEGASLEVDKTARGVVVPKFPGEV
jgi:L-ascorbate metabolism protein UlaG (beta-lactamase superfamily)